ncbi:MAG: DUF4124 domain-containing protein [Undibacterium sp.]|nr:DUF4124 domain-containing protein [Undibacterium sp.]
MLFILSVLLVCSLSNSSYAQSQSDVYVCIDAHGKKEYTNKGNTKGCKLLDIPRMNVIAAPASAKKLAANSTSTKSASSPSNFPKVDESTQKSRDSDRKQILTDELKLEEQKYEALKKEYNGGEVERRTDEKLTSKYMERVNNLKSDVSRTEKNIEALKRELGNLK